MKSCSVGIGRDLATPEAVDSMEAQSLRRVRSMQPGRGPNPTDTELGFALGLRIYRPEAGVWEGCKGWGRVVGAFGFFSYSLGKHLRSLGFKVWSCLVYSFCNGCEAKHSVAGFSRGHSTMTKREGVENKLLTQSVLHQPEADDSIFCWVCMQPEVDIALVPCRIQSLSPCRTPMMRTARRTGAIRGLMLRIKIAILRPR